MNWHGSGLRATRIVLLVVLVSPGLLGCRMGGVTSSPARAVQADEILPQRPDESDPDAVFEWALELERRGYYEEAFLAYMALPGAEHLAASLALSEPRGFLSLLLERDGEIAAPRARLVEGDLRLKLGQKSRALRCYREAAASVAEDEGQGWESGVMPATYYPVEPPPPTQTQWQWRPDASQRRAEPFAWGPGSHRGNWLIRRFIALDALDDAAREFARIWDLHRQDTQPYVTSVPVYEQAKVVRQERRLVRPQGFTGKGLQFALDYAYFLRRQGKPSQAFEVLAEALWLMDMDRNPNTPREGEPIAEDEAVACPERPGLLAGEPAWSRWGSQGISRKEFIRLAYGEYARADREDELLDMLTTRIEKGENRLRRVLAQVRLHQGRSDDALALELAYIEAGGFDALTCAYRRGLVYESLGHVAKAVAEFEKALGTPYTPLRVPDPDEEARERATMSAVPVMPPRYDTPGGEGRLRGDLIERLLRLYGSLGETERVLELTLKQFETTEARARDLGAVERAASLFRAHGQEQRFRTWARARLDGAPSPRARANLYWMLGDHAEVVSALALAAEQEKEKVNAYTFSDWKQRFREELGAGSHRALLKALVKANPKDVASRLELLDSMWPVDDGEAIAALEPILAGADILGEGGEIRNPRTRFRDCVELAYRLMRAYERTGRTDELLALGLRVARGEEPFGGIEPERYAYRDENGPLEHGNACLALAVQHADKQALEKLAAALDGTPWVGARSQVERRLRGEWPPPGGEPFGWANVPKGVTLLASNENVLDLCRDDRHVYAGHPWGVAVYDFDGNAITRIALQAAATALAAIDDTLWVGTPAGICRVDTRTYGVAFLSGDETGRPAGDDYAPRYDWPDDAVYGLAAREEVLWIGTERDVRRLDTGSNSLRIFSPEELEADERACWARFLFEGRHVWAEAQHAGCRRYDPKADTWARPAGPDERSEIGLIGVIDGQLWGHTRVSDELGNRPCLIDAERLHVTPILIEGRLAQEQRFRNTRTVYLGTYRGRPVFGCSDPWLLYDDAIGELRLLGGSSREETPAIETDIPEGLRSGSIWRRADGALTCIDGTTHRHEVFGRPFHSGRWTLLTLPNGTQVLGGASEYGTAYYDRREEWPFGEHVKETPDGMGGLHFIPPSGESRHVSAEPRSDSILGDEVFAVVPSPEDGQAWLCTRYGLSLLDSGARVLANITREDGLCANRVTSAVALGGKFYFSTGWWDHGGGLAVYNPDTTVFTSLAMVDGLATDKLASVSVEEGQLKLTYDWEYMRGSRSDDQRYRLYPAKTYDPADATVGALPEPRYARKPGSGPGIPGAGAACTPYLGGPVISRGSVGNRTVVCGTRGAAVLTDGPSGLRVARFSPRVTLDPRVKLLEDAQARPVSVRSPAELGRALRDKNPFYRANAMASLPLSAPPDDAYMRLIAGQLDDPEPCVRSTALYLITRWEDDREVVRLLQERLSDPDKDIRMVATVELVRRGEVPEMKLLREVFEDPSGVGNLDFGAESSLGIAADREDLHTALAPHATPELFGLLLEFPVHVDDYEPRQRALKELGQSLRRRPEGAEVLLAAYDQESGPRYQVRFAQAVFGYAGRELLPTLHEALKSEDRVVRSNAARACGAIGDASSIPHLLDALGLESGLSRASIVWALGELKAAEALPRLTELYVDMRNDEERHGAAGFRALQSQAALSGQYESLRDLEAIGAEWDELKAAALREPIDPRRNEELLTSRHVLEAVGKIGPEASQGFYRTLAGDRDSGARRAAACALAEGGEEASKENLALLRHLLADPDPDVQMTAATSLLILDQDVAQAPIREWLSSPRLWTRTAAIVELERVRDPAKLAFARDKISAIANNPAVDDEIRQRARELLGGGRSAPPVGGQQAQVRGPGL